MKTRAEHLAWCKMRALEYIDQPVPNIQEALASMASDLGKHPGTQGHVGMMLGFSMLAGGFLATREDARKFINDFN